MRTRGRIRGCRSVRVHRGYARKGDGGKWPGSELPAQGTAALLALLLRALLVCTPTGWLIPSPRAARHPPTHTCCPSSYIGCGWPGWLTR